jgi:phospholipid transport system substrate-binding protein
MMTRTVGVLVFALLLAGWTGTSRAEQAKDTLKADVDQILTILKTSKKGAPGRTQKLDAVLRGIFDAGELARLTLAANWKSFTPDERARFTEAFVKLLEHTYLRRIENYTNEQVQILSESSLGQNRSEVSTKIVGSSGDITVVYRLMEENGAWKVYDVVIEGVSLVMNYRSQFNQILATKTPDQLIADVQAKNQ